MLEAKSNRYFIVTPKKLEGKTMGTMAVSQGNFFLCTGDARYGVGNPD